MVPVMSCQSQRCKKCLQDCNGLKILSMQTTRLVIGYRDILKGRCNRLTGNKQNIRYRNVGWKVSINLLSTLMGHCTHTQRWPSVQIS